jgi:parallel beta-helix repeat protein
LLSSNLEISPKGSLHINSTDTKWLKIESTSDKAYHVNVLGNLKVDSVKISSWNTTSNNYALTNGKTPRSSFIVPPGASGKFDITNSEISHLGDGNVSRGQGLSYWAGAGSVIKNNLIHHMWYGFYSERVGNITIENNTIHGDMKYGIDPHTGTHDLIIRNNTVHDNGHIGIICSLDCKNLLIEGNRVFNNTDAGIMLSKNVQQSIIRNNRVEDENTGISISESSNNKIYNNDLAENNNGIQVKTNSANNRLYNNSIKIAAKCGIEISHSAQQNNVTKNAITGARTGFCIVDSPVSNIIYNNKIDSANGYAVLVRDSKSLDNIFKDNQLANVSRVPVKLINGSLKVINNTVN